MLILYIAGVTYGNHQMSVRHVDSYQCFLPEFWKRAAEEHRALGSADVEMLMILGRIGEIQDAGEKMREKAESLFDMPVSGVCRVEMDEWELQYVYPSFCREDRIPDVFGIWAQFEQPQLCGKQLVIQSFLFKDLAGRRIIGALPDEQSGQWFALLDGGGKLFFGEDNPYYRPRLESGDIGLLTIGQTDGILNNPGFGYGTFYCPEELCAEWHKVFEFALAASGETWDIDAVKPVYERFLAFLSQNICHTVEAEPVITKEHYLQALLQNMNAVRLYLRGEEEAVISKDLLLLMNSRYIYLPQVYQLMYQDNGGRETGRADTFDRGTLCAYLDRAAAGGSFEKGLEFEKAAGYFMAAAEGLRIAGKHVRTEFQEIDLCLVNVSVDQDLWEMGAFLLVECKNWKKPAGISVVRELGLTARMRGNKTTILISRKGWSEKAAEEARRQAAQEIYILCITEEELRRVADAKGCVELIKRKFYECRAAAGDNLAMPG